MKILIVIMLLLTGCSQYVLPEYTCISQNVYNYNGIIITDTIGDDKYIQDVVKGLYKLNEIGYLNLLYSNKITNIILDYADDNSVAWVLFNNNYFTDKIHLNAKYYYGDCYSFGNLTASIIHECWHVILNVKFKNLDNDKIREQICEKKEREVLTLLYR
jgi:hypothetical protein